MLVRGERSVETGMSSMMLTLQKCSGSRMARMKGRLSEVSDLKYQFDK